MKTLSSGRSVWFIVLWFTLFLLFAEACSPSTPASRRTAAETAATATPTSTPDPDQDIYWYGGQKYYPLYAIPADESNVVYLRGFTVHKFLNGVIDTVTSGSTTSEIYRHEQVFCLQADYQVLEGTGEDTKKITRHLVLRAIPVKINNFSLGRTERLLRVDLADADASRATCGGFTRSAGINVGLNEDVVYAISDVWPARTVTATGLTLWEVNRQNPAQLDIISIYQLDLRLLRLRLTAVQEVLRAGVACNDQNCLALGFDCCINGVCVHNGHLRPNAKNDPDYAQALLEVAENPAAFMHYPHLYYVCSNGQSPPTPKQEEKDPTVEGDARLAKLTSWYRCLKTVEDSLPQQDDLDGEVVENNANFSQCFDPNGDTSIDRTVIAWNHVRRLVWQMCGCVGINRYEAANQTVFGLEGDASDEFSAVDPEPYCPKISLAAVVDAQENIVNIVCRMPHNDLQGRPQQELNITVSGRSAPMRFYTGNHGQYYKEGIYYTFERGDSIDHLENLANAVPAVIAEGTPFAYLDENGSSEPDNLAYNFNSIIGQMVVGLSQAHPAQEIDVEFGQIYIISATSGYYTPCPMCRKDSWNDLFSAYPSSEMGSGTKAFGYITDRSAYQNNIYLGNYEDTLFGRACWLPPTMLPFSHQPHADLITQRLDRQQTQAALWANGYQRDWFGFNQGALIGSFDGVNWFAIGSGRKITAQSTKLFLAINAPYADLADPSIINVHLVTSVGNDTVAEYDYDPNYEINSPYQNQAATCQAYHLCSTDQDCLTQLGPEYMCADVSKFKTLWPSFNTYAQELPNETLAKASYQTILRNHTYLAGNTKRCVYRGAGALCKRNYTSLYTTQKGERVPSDLSKMFTCAPNFFCADWGGTYFNDRVVRTTESTDNFMYGQEADLLGRPQDYVRAQRRLPDNILSNLNRNAALISDEQDFGLCRPGRYLGGTPLEQQQRQDEKHRTDYISQRGSCDSTAKGFTRVQSCPVLDEDGNYLFNPDFNDEATAAAAIQQNACGAESLTSEGINIFAEIEAGSLTNILGTFIPTLAADACLGRAGVPCQTDLECSPNILHREQVALYDFQAFGGSEAEAKYWEENLVCGQSDPRPAADSSFNESYQLTNNRCCREVGQELSMYTQFNKQEGDPELIPDQGEDNFNFEVERFAYLDPAAENRYSRYSVVAPFKTAADVANWLTEPYPAAPKLTTTEQHVPEFPAPYQWKAINDVGQKTCCGRTFIRQFSDGTHQWPIGKRLNLNPQSFQCLNYESNFSFLSGNAIKEAIIDPTAYGQEMLQFCSSPANGQAFERGELASATSGKRDVWMGGCTQVPIVPSIAREILYPIPNYIYYPTTRDALCRVDFSRTSDGGLILQACAPYVPTNAAPSLLSSDEGDSDTCLGHYFCNNKAYSFLHLLLPAYLPEHQFVEGTASISIKFIKGDNNLLGKNSVIKIQTEYEQRDQSMLRNKCDQGGKKGCTAEDITDLPICEQVQTDIMSGHYPNLFSDERYMPPQDGSGTPGTDYFPTNSFCRSKDLQGRTVISILAAPVTGETSEDAWDNAGMIFSFIPYGRPGFSYTDGETITTESRLTNPTIAWSNLMGEHEGQVAGNDLYYMTKLGRLDLLGIPQIFYEPIYCNTLGKDLVPNIFKQELQERQDFNQVGFSFTRPDNQVWQLANLYDSNLQGADRNNILKKVVFQDQVVLDQVFSGHDFTCCRGLGLYTTSAGLCCSGHATSPAEANDDSEDDKTLYCDLPEGTDLHVYFNRFVSSEGISEDLPTEYRLLDTDFIPETGEPKMTEKVERKIFLLGLRFCNNHTVINGSSLGDYVAEDSPRNNAQVATMPFTIYGSADESHQKYYSVLDSSRDYNQDTDKGYRKFIQGYRWSHHYYCGPKKDSE